MATDATTETNDVTTNSTETTTIQLRANASEPPCRTPSCHSRANVREIENDSLALCRYCRKQFLGVSS